HVPLLKFIGPRKAVWGMKAMEPQGAQPSPVAAQTGAINFWELPARYRPLPMSEAEIEAIESGGASLL
ncbi:hypothetical protein LPJ61_005071, partial [Coemansia biformis]